MERRIAVLAGAGIQALTCRARGAWMIALAVVALAGATGTADARPKRKDAKAEFNRGIAAYQKGNYEAASAALGKSFALEGDIETLFAWAQAERKLEHCDKAIELYEKLMTFNLPAANKEAVDQKLTECRVIIAQQKAAAEPPPAASKPEPPVAPKPESPPVGDHAGSGPTRGTAETTARAWYADPVALVLLGTGVAAGGTGAGFLLSAQSLGNKSKHATSYPAAEDFKAKAKSRGNIGLVTAGVGSALVVGGVVWIVLHRRGTEQPPVTGWLAPGGGGLAISGAF